MPKKENWELRYNTLKDFYNTYGHFNIKNWDGRYVDGIDLSQWIKQLRQKYRKNLLTDNQIRDLNAINFPWKTARTMNWDEKYAVAKKYYEDNGTVDINSSVQLKDGYALGVWIYQQRMAYRNGELTDTQIQLLNELGFESFTQDKFEKRWEENLAIAKEYYEEFGTINVEHNEVYKDFKIGNWLTNAIADYHEGTLPKERIEQLEELGIAWVRSGDDYSWNKNYYQLKNYLKNYSVDDLTIESNSTLYNWLERQKYLIEINELEEDKLNKMIDLDISFKRKTRKNDNWDYNYGLAKKFYEEHGHLIMSKNYITEDGQRLGYFLQGRRNAMKGVKGYKITQEEIDLLNEIGMVWGSTKEAEWKYNLDVLKEYLQSTEEPFPMSRGLIYKKLELGKFVYDTQVKVKSNKLPEQQLQDILAILPEIETVKTLTDKQVNLTKIREITSKEKENELKIKQQQEELRKSLEEITPVKVDVIIKSIEDNFVGLIDVRTGNWIENFKSLREYLVLNPTIPVDKHKLNEFKPDLASWLYKYINDYKNGVLKDYQVEIFDSLEIDLQRLFPLNIELKWLNYYDLFMTLLDSEKISNIFKDYPDLRDWYSTNVARYQEDKLNIFRRDKINLLMDKIDASF